MSEPTAGPLKRTPLHALHQELGARLVPFAGYEMPVQYPTGILAEHAQTRTAAGLFDVSHMGQVRLTGKTGQSAAKALESAGAGRHRGPAARPAALHAVHQRERRNPRRSDGDLDRRSSAGGGQRRLQGRRPRAYPEAPVGKLRDRADVLARAARAAGPAGIAGAGAAGAVGRDPEIHDRRLRHDRRRAVLRHALGLYRRRRLRDLDAGRQGRPDRAIAAGPAGGQADRAGRARFAAPRSGPLPLRPRHRHHDDADRGGPAVEHRQGAPRPGWFPRRVRHPEADRRGCAAQARRPPARRQGDRARGRGDRDRRQDRRQGHVGWFCADARSRRRHGLRRESRSRPTAPRSSLWCAASPCRPRSCPCPSSSMPTTADRRLR